jgi:hypothetical protein
LTSITAVVLGGTSLLGGRGTFIGTLLGAGLSVQVLNATVFLNLDQKWQYIFQGPADRRRRHHLQPGASEGRRARLFSRMESEADARRSAWRAVRPGDLRLRALRASGGRRPSRA